MIVQLDRASARGKKPDKIAYPLTEESAEFFKENWYDDWLADIPSLEWAFDKWGAIIIRKSDIKVVKYRVTIYDDYVE